MWLYKFEYEPGGLLSIVTQQVSAVKIENLMLEDRWVTNNFLAMEINFSRGSV